MADAGSVITYGILTEYNTTAKAYYKGKYVDQTTYGEKVDEIDDNFENVNNFITFETENIDWDNVPDSENDSEEESNDAEDAES